VTVNRTVLVAVTVWVCWRRTTLVLVDVGAVIVEATVPEKTVWTAGVMVDVVTARDREVTVVVDAGAVESTTTGEAETVIVVVSGPSGPTRFASALRLDAPEASRGSWRACWRPAVVDADLLLLLLLAFAIASAFLVAEVHLARLVMVLVLELVVAVRVVCRTVFVLVIVVDG